MPPGIKASIDKAEARAERRRLRYVQKKTQARLADITAGFDLALRMKNWVLIYTGPGWDDEAPWMD